MKIKLFAASIFFTLQSWAQFYPMIQTHKFEMEPYLKKSEGYAFFISSSTFDGAEKITVFTPNNTLLPDTQSNNRVLTQYSGPQWYIADKERVISAQAGALLNGVYKFRIETKTTSHTVTLQHENHFLNPASDIKINQNENSIDLSWQADPQAHTFWIFVFHENTKDILRDLTAVSSVMHVGSNHTFSHPNLKPGIYKIAIRSQSGLAP